MKQAVKHIWFLLGYLSVLLGGIGIFLPLLPTVPFLLLAAFFFAKSSEKAHQWLVHHKTLGPPIRDWNEKGAIRPPAKVAATACIILAFLSALVFGAPYWALGIQVLILAGVMLFIWTRPGA